MINKDTIRDRFMRYVQIDTQSDPESHSNPSTEKQKNLSRLLVKEMLEMGISDAVTDEFGYVYGTVPATSKKKNIPVIAFCSHVDTAPDCSGTDVKPLLHTAYDGRDIVLPDDPAQILRMSDSPYLKNHIGSEIITASGLTLLGADDKSGVASIMEAAHYLLQHPEIPHGAIRIFFTPDEEVGRGTEKADLKRLGASFGYTLDGGEAGSLEDETFSADAASVTFHGVITHPGYAKDKLINAIKLAGYFMGALPAQEWSPETTSGRQGFVHPVGVSGNAENATVSFIVRDFETAKLAEHHDRLKAIAEKLVASYPGTSVTYKIQEQYRNMKDVLVDHPEVTQYAAEAIRRAGLELKMESIRGGTDGSRLSYMGLPCPNIFTGMQNIHSKLEWIGVNDMAKAAETIVHLCCIWEEKA
jgi:tripeptide aminopeptidase